MEVPEREDWQRIWDINVDGPHRAARHSGARMTERGRRLPAETLPRRLVCLIRSAARLNGVTKNMLAVCRCLNGWRCPRGDGDQGIGVCPPKSGSQAR